MRFLLDSTGCTNSHRCMIRARISLAALAATCLLLLSSCLDYDEDMTIHKDLSGEVFASITLPDSLISSYMKISPEFEEAKLRARFDAMSGVSLVSYSKSTDRRPVVKLHIKFTSLEKLNEAIAANKPAAILGGQFTITKEDGKTRIVRKLGVGDPLNDLPQSNWIQYKTHFDGKIAGTNSGFYDQANSDVRYRYKLTELLANLPTQETTLARATPWMWIFICLVVIAAAAYYGWKLTGKKVIVQPKPLHAGRGPAGAPTPAASASPAASKPATPASKPAAPAPAPAAPPPAPASANPPAAAPPPAPAAPTPGTPQRPTGPPRPQKPGPPQRPGPGPRPGAGPGGPAAS